MVTQAQDAVNEAENEVNADAQLVNDWEDVRNSSDPVRLWARIRQTHLAVDTGVSITNQKEARSKRSRIFQSPNESLVTYKQRFEEAMNGMKTVGIPPIADSDQSVDLLVLTVLDTPSFEFSFKLSSLAAMVLIHLILAEHPSVPHFTQ